VNSRKILVPIDFANSMASAPQYAVAFAREYHAALTFFPALCLGLIVEHRLMPGAGCSNET
jgi:hypothetical protein